MSLPTFSNAPLKLRLGLVLTLSCLWNAQIYADEPAHFAKADVSLGIVPQGTQRTVDFVLKNQTAAPLKVVATDASCRCTSIQDSPAQIAANGEGSFKWTFNSSRAEGSLIQTVTAELDNGKTVEGRFHVWVEPPAHMVASPEEINATAEPGQKATEIEASLSGRSDIIKRAKIELPKGFTATASEPVKVEHYPEIERIDYKISVPNDLATAGRSEIVRWSDGKNRVEVAIRITSGK